MKRLCHPVRAGAGVDAGDPQAAEFAFRFSAVAIGVLTAVVNRLLRGLEEFVTASAVTGSLLEYLLRRRFDAGLLVARGMIKFLYA